MNRLLFAALPLFSPVLLAQGVLESAEPNNSTATAAVLPNGVQGYGDITAGDEDWFKITLAAASDLKVWTGAGFLGPIGDTRVRIYAADGVTILADVDDGNTATHGYYTTFAVGNYAAGDYYVAVRGFGATTVGAYTLDVVVATPGTYAAVLPPLTSVAESAEDNDPRHVAGVATASNLFTLNGGNTVAGAGGSTDFDVAAADYDFYALNITSPGLVTMETITGAAAPANTDTVIHFADSTFTRLAYDDEGGAGSLSLLSYNVTTPGTYYAVVSGWGSGSTGNYLLRVTGPLAPLPTGQASVTMQSGGCGPNLSTRPAGTGSGSELPVLGSQFWVDGTGLQPNTLLFRVIGLLPRNVPFNLGPLGAPGCQIEVNGLDASAGISDAAGVLFWNVNSPFTLALIGLPLEQQLVALDSGANALGVVVSNRVSTLWGITH
ncbi:MAG: PPC domain-containing protein [Planctomycetes bacterium]|nr:PPC domain-containing protein [Planctomycetota bacterium]MCB9886910.1 PPC domain-containing protein [Planctomycetota bacterium]